MIGNLSRASCVVIFGQEVSKTEPWQPKVTVVQTSCTGVRVFLPFRYAIYMRPEEFEGETILPALMMIHRRYLLSIYDDNMILSTI